MMRYFLSIILCHLTIFLDAQKSVSTDDLLFGNLNVISTENSEAVLELPQFGALSIVDKWEFRTETDEWDFSRQEYTLRASFNGFSSKNIYNEINNVNRETFLLFDKQYHENAIFQKYKSIVELYYLQQKNMLADSLLIILKDKKAIVDFEIANGSSSNINELVNIDFAIREIGIDQNTYEFKKKLLLQQLGVNSDANQFLIDTTAWIRNITIIDVLAINDVNLNSEINLKSQKLKYRNLELERQNSEAKRILDFAQLKYAGRNQLTALNEFSVGFGINIPTKSSNIRKRSEALVDKLEDELELKQIKANVYQEIEELIFKIKMKNLEYNSYDKYIREIESSKTSMSFDLYSDPNSGLEYKLNNLKLHKDILNIENQLVEDYLELLMIKGWFLYYPDVNFLSDNFKLD